jgi:opacity protein-like surface antigen
VSGKYKAAAASLAGVGLIPFTPNLSLYGKAGLHYNTVDLSASTKTSNSESRAGWLAGVGLRYDFEGSLYTRVGWEHYAKVGENGATGGGSIDLLQIAIGMRF